LQQKLLAVAMDSVKVGGVVAYVTCSPHLSETDQVIRAGLKKTPGFEVLDARELLPEVAGLGEGPAIRLWPQFHDTDGMYMSVLRRVG